MTADKLRIVLGDDHHLVVEALRSTLKRRYEIVAVAHNAADILQAVEEHQPDLLLLDLSLPERNGLEIIPDVRRIAPNTRTIVVTMHLDRVLAESSLTAGAMGFVPKDAGLKELEKAIHSVMRGANFISPSVPMKTSRVSLLAAHAALALLTPRQHEIVKLIAEGRTSPEIATQLSLSESTVAFHRGNIREKLGVDSVMGLMRYAVLLQLDNTDAGSGDPTGLTRPERKLSD
jgi:DNA-binding NarL/FixJ family response regulator